MAITRDEVQKVALLARLLPDENELEGMTTQLGRILGYMDLLGEVDTEGVEPMAHPFEMTDVLREDKARESVDREKMLRSAPGKNDQCYLVPAVLGQK